MTLILLIYYQQNIKNLIQKIVKLTKGGKPQYGKIKLRKEEALKIKEIVDKLYLSSYEYD